MKVDFVNVFLSGVFFLHVVPSKYSFLVLSTYLEMPQGATSIHAEELCTSNPKAVMDEGNQALVNQLSLSFKHLMRSCGNTIQKGESLNY